MKKYKTILDSPLTDFSRLEQLNNTAIYTAEIQNRYLESLEKEIIAATKIFQTGTKIVQIESATFDLHDFVCFQDFGSCLE